MPLSKPQELIVNTAQRFRVVIAGRRFGKTHLSIRELCYYAKEPEQTIWYVAPTYKQAKMIAFKALRKRLTELRWVRKVNETNLEFELKNGSTISLKGADNYDSLRGVGLDFLVLDEFADIDPEAWFETLRPTLSDKQGKALFIGTPKGLNWAHDLYTMEQEYPEEWKSFQFTTEDGGNVKPEEIEAARRTLDEKTFNQEYRATFETFSGRIFYAFDRKVNVKSYTGDIPGELHIGVDFNVSNLCGAVAIKLKDGLHFIDEIRLVSSNTDELVEEIKNRYPNNRIVCYPDPSGSARKTSAGGKTDHTILRNAGFRVLAPNRHNPVRDGINAVNALLCSTTGEHRMTIDPKCRNILESLEKHCYKENSNIPDKDSGFDHMSDAFRYVVDYLFPIKRDLEPQPQQFWGHKLSHNQDQVFRR